MAGPVDNLVRAFATHLEAVAASGCAKATIILYDGRYKAFLSYLKAEGFEPPFALNMLNPTNARRCGLWVKEHSRGARGGEHAMRMELCVLKIGSAWLADEGYLLDGIDPLARVRRSRATSGIRLPLTQDDVRALIGASVFVPTGTRDVAMIHLLLDCGMRSGGICSILASDLDLKERRVVLRLKGGREHVLYFGSSERRDGGHTVRALRHYMEDRAALVARWSRFPDRARGHLFLGVDGRPLAPAGFRVSLRQLAQHADLDGVFPHRFRHTFATMFLVRHPGDETGLRGILGHLSNDMFRAYTHLAHEIIAQRAGRVSLAEAWLGDESTMPPARPGPILLSSVGPGVAYDERPGPASGKGRQEPGRLPNPRTGRRSQV